MKEKIKELCETIVKMAKEEHAKRDAGVPLKNVVYEITREISVGLGPFYEAEIQKEKELADEND